MQPLARTDPVTGSALTADQVHALIQDTPAPILDVGLDLLDINLGVVADLSDFFPGGSVTRSNYATLHGTADLGIATELDWGTAIVRPWMTFSDGTVTARFNLGAYLTDSPKTDLGENPITHQVQAYDILDWLNSPVGEAYVVADGTGYLDAVVDILTAQGLTQYQIDQTAAAQVLESPMTWAFSEDTTWLNVVNDLLAAVGYQGIWSDWDGQLRIQPYILPTDRATEWLYTSDQASTMLAQKKTITRDFYRAPNKWVFHWAKDPAGAQPVEGAGIYTFENDADGPTSIAARGRVITAKPEQIDVVDQAALVAAAQQRIDADIRLKTTVEVQTAPNPAHWHFDRVTIADPALGPIAQGLEVKWTLPLDGGDQAHEWSLI